ncbi:TetR family transcriptional regulator [Glaciihabitans tibetensis]|uniref:TetR family transcriptional regulator n=1 Tax=Glaciihabitans tibetensis TaxID=1266600 RepID=A0A2T0VIA2_9MICO|nr:TetR/AcrR family transcriptional regulator [Glaciihabitans tibetensis]PRY69938.1 TetR family transcriptional regulator [Glaciihabitans tibetensis]
MNDQQEVPTVQGLVRTEPIQQRSAQRVEKLLDAAAEIIHADGIDSLTTSDVAIRSGSSVGVVYRYFPNIQSLLRALAARNLEHYTDRVFAALENDQNAWRNALDAAIDTFVDMHRNHVGFRALRFGDVINDRFLDPSLSNNGVFSRAIAGILGEKYNFVPTDDLIFDLEIIVEIENALMKRAFLLEPQGDERFIQKAREIARGYLRESTHLPVVP